VNRPFFIRTQREHIGFDFDVPFWTDRELTVTLSVDCLSPPRAAFGQTRGTLGEPCVSPGRTWFAFGQSIQICLELEPTGNARVVSNREYKCCGRMQWRDVGVLLSYIVVWICIIWPVKYGLQAIVAAYFRSVPLELCKSRAICRRFHAQVDIRLA